MCPASRNVARGENSIEFRGESWCSEVPERGFTEIHEIATYT